MRARFLRVLTASVSTFRKQIMNELPPKHDVFLSFRGSDTRTGFADFLYKGLLTAGVSVFRDQEALPFGEHIDKELHQAVRTCRIAIPIISPHFVESRSCNQELAEMINRRYGLEEVEEWREALTSVARIRGWTSQTLADGYVLKSETLARPELK